MVFYCLDSLMDFVVGIMLGGVVVILSELVDVNGNYIYIVMVGGELVFILLFN